MTLRTHVMLFGALALSMTFAGAARTETAEGAKPFVLAQGPPLSEQEKAKRKEEERRKGPPPGPAGEKKGPPPGPPAKAQSPTPPGGPPAGNSVLTPPDKGPPVFEKKAPSAARSICLYSPRESGASTPSGTANHTRHTDG